MQMRTPLLDALSPLGALSPLHTAFRVGVRRTLATAASALALLVSLLMAQAAARAPETASRTRNMRIIGHRSARRSKGGTWLLGRSEAASREARRGETC